MFDVCSVYALVATLNRGMFMDVSHDGGELPGRRTNIYIDFH